MVGGEGASPPLEIRKKMLSEEILTSFTYVFLMKLGGGSTYMQNGRGWADRRLSMVGPGREGLGITYMYTNFQQIQASRSAKIVHTNIFANNRKYHKFATTNYFSDCCFAADRLPRWRRD